MQMKAWMTNLSGSLFDFRLFEFDLARKGLIGRSNTNKR